MIEKRNIFEVDLIGYTITHREAFHIFNNSKIQQSFMNCRIIGQCALNDLVSKVVDNRVIGSLDFLRKQLTLKKIHPIEGKKKIGVKSILPLSKLNLCLNVTSLQPTHYTWMNTLKILILLQVIQPQLSHKETFTRKQTLKT